MKVNPTKIDPAQFVVRRETYWQVKGYPRDCAELTEKLLAYSPEQFPQAYEFLMRNILLSPALNRDWGAKRRKGFGISRTDYMETSLLPKYAEEEEEIRRLYTGKNDSLIEIRYNNKMYHEPIKLSCIRLENGENGSTIIHPDIEDEQLDHEHRWSAICQYYLIATGTVKSSLSRPDASKICYALLYADCNQRRGSAMFSRIILEYLSHKAEFEVPYARSGIDLNTRAITRPVELFLREWDEGVYFDFDVTAQEIMAWHNARVISPKDFSVSNRVLTK